MHVIFYCQTIYLGGDLGLGIRHSSVISCDEGREGDPFAKEAMWQPEQGYVLLLLLFVWFFRSWVVLQDQWMPLLHMWPISNVTCFSSKHRYYTYRMFYKYILSQLHISTGLSSCTRRECSHWIWIHVGCELYVQSVVSSYVRLARYSRKAATQREAELCGLSTHQCYYFQQTGLAEIASQTPVKYRNQ